MNIHHKAYKVVVGYDFTMQADTALALALQSLLDKDRPELHAVYACTENGSQAEALRESNQKELSRILHKVAEGFPGTITLYAHSQHETPAKAILRLAAEIEADAIFVGTHKRKGFSRLVMGSVAEQVMRLASCAVTVAKERSYLADKNDELILLEPLCKQCVFKRNQTEGEKWWCDAHTKPHQAPYRYSHRSDVARLRSKKMPLAMY